MIKTLLIVFWMFLISFLPGITLAQDLNPNYRKSVDLAIDTANSPTDWRPASLFVIRTTAIGAPIVRSATKSGNFSSNYVGEAS